MNGARDSNSLRITQPPHHLYGTFFAFCQDGMLVFSELREEEEEGGIVRHVFGTWRLKSRQQLRKAGLRRLGVHIEPA